MTVLHTVSKSKSVHTPSPSVEEKARSPREKTCNAITSMYDKPLSDPLPKSPASSYYGNRALGKENTQTFQKILDVRFELALM